MSIIDTLCVELTVRCPLRCIHCSANALPERSQFIDFKALSRRLLELGSLKEVYFSGGEPFEYPHLLDSIGIARSISSSIIIYSSGVTIGRVGIEPLSIEMLAQAYDAGATRFDLSLYAAAPDLHDSITLTQDSFDCTVESAIRLRELNIPFGIHYVPVGAAENEVKRVAELAQDLGATRLHILALAPQGRGRTLGNYQPTSKFLGAVEEMLSHPFSFNLVLSSELRLAINHHEPTERDRLRAAFLDVHGYFYPGEGQRILTLRSHLPILSNNQLKDIIEDLPF